MNNEDVLYDLVLSGEWRIDNQGKIWRQKDGEWIRTEHRTPQSYLQVRKMRNGIRIHTGAHRLVCRHFVGPIPPGMTVNHKNGVKDDNRPENLEIASYSENMRHAFRTELKSQWGENNPAARLTNIQVEEIRKRYAEGGVTQAQLGEKYGVTFQTISDIVRGDRRKSQKGPTADYTCRRQNGARKRNTKGQFSS